MTPGSLFYGIIFSTTYTEKNNPKAMNFMEKGITFLCRILTIFLRRKITPGHYSRGSFFYNLHGEKWPQGYEFWWLKAINFTEKGVFFLCRILTGGSNFYVEKLPPVIILRGHFSTTYTEKYDPRAMNCTEKGVTFLRRTLTGGHIST
jgi:hypothetical protein